MHNCGLDNKDNCKTDNWDQDTHFEKSDLIDVLDMLVIKLSSVQHN